MVWGEYGQLASSDQIITAGSKYIAVNPKYNASMIMVGRYERSCRSPPKMGIGGSGDGAMNAAAEDRTRLDRHARK